MRKNRVLLGALIVALFIGALAGCSKSGSSYGMSSAPPPPPAPKPNVVNISGYAFSPASMTVAKGTTVTWQNDDGVTHTATSNSGSWDTGGIASGANATITFNTSGTFAYHCTIHPMMTGTIVVQ